MLNCVAIVIQVVLCHVNIVLSVTHLNFLQ